ncbi:MAG: hypothetical protein U1F43_30385 [Myxococcota bacterium]
MPFAVALWAALGAATPKAVRPPLAPAAWPRALVADAAAAPGGRVECRCRPASIASCGRSARARPC